MNREIHVPLRESPEVKSLWATRPANGVSSTMSGSMHHADIPAT